MSVNGQFQPSITMKSKEVQLWRVVNGTIDKVVPMCLMPLAGTAAPAPEAYVLAVDGVPLQKPVWPRTRDRCKSPPPWSIPPTATTC
ncbi:hypothetical protein [Methylogaea oryzae]|uniref:hypothetical protein n=1 Tax=Methylogaea oryzae TaxID=1295382 RepID=UPI0006CFAE64|nr:hypothetical protein [Methylogaea oryzae]